MNSNIHCLELSNIVLPIERQEEKKPECVSNCYSDLFAINFGNFFCPTELLTVVAFKRSKNSNCTHPHGAQG
jgi:hypothetical protein